MLLVEVKVGRDALLVIASPVLVTVRNGLDALVTVMDSTVSNVLVINDN